MDEDRSQLSERIITAFYPPRFKTRPGSRPAEIDPGLDTGLYTFVVDIPPDFERDVLQGRPPRSR